MRQRLGAVFLLGLWVGGWGCASSNPNVRVRRLPDGRLQVEGPLAGPFQTQEELAEKACWLMTSQPGAANGYQGMEYCALHYYVPEDRAFYLSYLSDVGGSPQSGTKYCEIPRTLLDPTHKDIVILGGAHTHPYNRKFSSKDMSIRTRWNPTRFYDKSTGRIWDRQLMVFFLEKTGECRAYRYNNATRIIEALREGQWVSIGKTYNDDGDIQLFEGQDWLP